MQDQWQLQDAKSRFSELVDRALREGPQVVTRHGQKVVVVVPYDQYQQLTRPAGNLADFLLSSPLAGTELNLGRKQNALRDLNLEA